MKGIKVLGVIILFGIALFLALGFKKRIVQVTCDGFGDYEATKGTELLGADTDEGWYCCLAKQDKNTKNCLYYGE